MSHISPMSVYFSIFGALMALNGVGWSVATTTQLALLVARPPGGITTTAAMGYFAGAASVGCGLGQGAGNSREREPGARPLLAFRGLEEVAGVLAARLGAA